VFSTRARQQKVWDRMYKTPCCCGNFPLCAGYQYLLQLGKQVAPLNFGDGFEFIAGGDNSEGVGGRVVRLCAVQDGTLPALTPPRSATLRFFPQQSSQCPSRPVFIGRGREGCEGVHRCEKRPHTRGLSKNRPRHLAAHPKRGRVHNVSGFSSLLSRRKT